jgi:hypothetical protein
MAAMHSLTMPLDGATDVPARGDVQRCELTWSYGAFGDRGAARFRQGCYESGDWNGRSSDKVG